MSSRSRSRSRSYRNPRGGISRPLQYGALGALLAVTIALVVLAVTSRSGSTAGEAGTVRDPAPAETTTAVPTGGPWDDITSVYVLGDSFTGGSRENEGETWPRLLGAQRGWTIETDGAGGTGYVTPGAFGVFLERVGDVAPASPDLVIVAGGRNDVNRIREDAATISDVTAAATAVIESVREATPTSDVLLLSPFASGDSDDLTNELRDALAEVATANGVQYLDVTGYLSEGEIGSDGVHPTDAGHAALTNRIGSALDELSLPNPAKWQPAS